MYCCECACQCSPSFLACHVQTPNGSSNLLVDLQDLNQAASAHTCRIRLSDKNAPHGERRTTTLRHTSAHIWETLALFIRKIHDSIWSVRSDSHHIQINYVGRVVRHLWKECPHLLLSQMVSWHRLPSFCLNLDRTWCEGWKGWRPLCSPEDEYKHDSPSPRALVCVCVCVCVYTLTLECKMFYARLYVFLEKKWRRGGGQAWTFVSIMPC